MPCQLRQRCLTMTCMDIPTDRPADMLERVVGELERRTGQMRLVAAESGLAYDTVLRIKNREGEPAYGKVRQLHDYLFLGNVESLKRCGIDGALVALKGEG